MGTIYLIHFDQPYKQAQHYLGYTDNLEERLERHRSGNGNPLMKAVTQGGIPWKVVRTWENADRDFERRLHNRKNSPAQLCPICVAKRRAGITEATT